MRAANVGRFLEITIVAALAGCTHAPVPPAGTGAEEAAQSYYEALVRKDWSNAYALLDPASRHRCRQEQFERLALQHLRTLGFAPREVYVRACEEHADEAIAHVVLTAQAASQQRFYRDALVLRHESGSWRIVLSPKATSP